MVYTLAAYSITIGVLVLYGVFLQHRSKIATSQLAATYAATRADAGQTPGALDSADSGMNVGAALLAPFWMWAHGLRAPAAFVLLALAAVVPLYQRELWIALVAVASIPLSAGAALAVVGNRIAAAHLGIREAGALSTRQFPWAVAGVLLYTAVLPWVAYWTGVLGAGSGA